MLYNTGYVSWDFSSIWTIENGKTIAYLRNVIKPDSVKKENIDYELFDIVGSGTPSDPYIITTALQLQKINENLEAYYKLGANIDLNGIEFVSIGNETYPFKGTLDGNGYKISNLNLNKNENNLGLFGYNSGTLKNIIVNNLNIIGANNIGVLAGYNTGTITGCKTLNSTSKGVTNIGGLVRILYRKY